LEAAGEKSDILYSFCHEFLVQLRRSLRGFGENPENILPYTGTAENLQSSCKTVPELFDWLKEIITAVVKYVSGKRKSREFDVIQEAKNYIDSNFSEDLSLGRVASKVYMSPTYFSALFKSKTGENFSDYLTKVRMEYAAKKLSDSSFKTYEIAGTFGYKNPRYFSEAFKKYYGVTPSEYKDKLNKQ
jgi:two-component system response regulator YesN